jgi:hypothetical protein
VGKSLRREPFAARQGRGESLGRSAHSRCHAKWHAKVKVQAFAASGVGDVILDVFSGDRLITQIALNPFPIPPRRWSLRRLRADIRETARLDAAAYTDPRRRYIVPASQAPIV